MHVATNKPNIVELNAGASKVKAGWSKTEGWRILTRYLAAEPNGYYWTSSSVQKRILQVGMQLQYNCSCQSPRGILW